jgi:serine/threonine protein kinase
LIIAGEVLGGRFEVRRRLGSGGMGDVFEAFDRDRGEVVAIKTLTRADADTFARFKREFRALQSMVHPNLVSIGELVCADELWFFSMELVEGVHFQEHVRGDVGGLRSALRQLVVGIHALHEGGLVHRDIKPSNVMITRDGRLVILDFGLVTHVDPKRQSFASGPVGTVEYMAPEQARGETVDERADIYALGLILYDLLLGRRRAERTASAIDELEARKDEPPPSPRSVDKTIPEALDEIITRSLQPDPKARFQHTLDLVAALDRLDDEGRMKRVAR